MSDIDWEALAAAATAAREQAYAPYSGYRVGAAILGGSGRVYVGCNVENASYGLCLCAERSAVAQMITAGERTPAAIAVATSGPEPGPPCGLCRQTLAELATTLPIALVVNGKIAKTTSLEALFPEPFRLDG